MNLCFQYVTILKLPSIEIMKIEDTKHLPQLERPDTFIEQLAVILSYEDETTI